MEKKQLKDVSAPFPSREGLGVGLFDELVERRGTGCVKWDESPSEDVIPLWVADMDFKAAPAIQEAIKKRAEHGVFGYTHVDETYYEPLYHTRFQTA